MISRPVYELLQTVVRSNPVIVDTDKNLEIFLKNELYEYDTKGADQLVHKTMRLAWEIYDQCRNAKDTLERLANSLESHGVDWNMLEKELSLDEMHQIGENFVQTARELNKGETFKVPEIPFGHKNNIWEWMLRDHQNGDKFFRYGTVNDKNDPHRPYRSGYCMVRGNKILIVLTTMRS